MIGPERGRYREKVAKFVTDAQAAEAAGFASVWFTQVPDDFDAIRWRLDVWNASAQVAGDVL